VLGPKNEDQKKLGSLFPSRTQGPKKKYKQEKRENRKTG